MIYRWGGVINRRVPEAGNMQKCFVSLRPNCSLAIWRQLKGAFLHITGAAASVYSNPTNQLKRFGDGDRRNRNREKSLQYCNYNLYVNL